MASLKAAIKWINALKRYEGKKTIGTLKRNEGQKAKYCCLGVACHVNRLPMDYDKLKLKLGLKSSIGSFITPLYNFTNLVGLNDAKYATSNNFRKIRGHILSRIDELFIPKIAEGLKQAKKLGQI